MCVCDGGVYVVPNESSDSSDDEGDNEDAPDTVGTNEATSTGPSTADEGEAPGPSTANEGEAPGPSTANEGEAPGPSTANEAPGSSDINEGEEDESDLKLAWEILELARVICQKLVPYYSNTVLYVWWLCADKMVRRTS